MDFYGLNGGLARRLIDHQRMQRALEPKGLPTSGALLSGSEDEWSCPVVLLDTQRLASRGGFALRTATEQEQRALMSLLSNEISFGSSSANSLILLTPQGNFLGFTSPLYGSSGPIEV